MTNKIGMYFRLLLCVSQLCLIPHAFSECQYCGYLWLDTGYRWDKISNRVNLFGENFGDRTSSQTAKQLNSFQLGVKGKFALNCWLLKGSYHHGWLADGRYDEAGFRGKARGHTNDALGGIGYYFCLNRCMWVAPLVGWSCDELNITGKNIIDELTNVGDIKYKSRFQGPWVGVDFTFQPSPCYWATFGYELHHADWHGTRLLEDGELGTNFGFTTGFSNKRRHKNIWGHVFELDGTYVFRECWNVGLSLKYQIWKAAGTGHYKRTIVPADPAITSKVVNDVEWESFSLMVHAGYAF